MMKSLQLDVLSDEIIKQLEKFIQLPIAVFNEHELLYSNTYFQSTLKEAKIDSKFHNLYHDITVVPFQSDQEIKVKNSSGEVFYFDAKISQIIFRKRQAFFAILLNISDRKKNELHVTTITKLRSLIIEISNSILDSTDLNTFFNFVLITTLKAFERAQLGTILKLNDGIFKPVASVGFSKNIEEFRLPLTECFLHRLTAGAMDRVGKVSNTKDLNYYIPVVTEYGEDVYIQSSLSAPIYFQGKLYGLINVDSLSTNAFDNDDIQAVEFISKSIEIAITNRLLYEEKVYLSRFDRLTGLYNRHFFDNFSDVIIKRALRYGESFHLVMIDVDNLKYANDQFSHLVGDEILAHLAKLIKDNMRDSDVFARYGGDEYIGIIFNSQLDALVTKFEQLNNEFSQHIFMYGDFRISSAVSYGIATFSDDGTSIYDLIRVADLRMYDYKSEQKLRKMIG